MKIKLSRILIAALILLVLALGLVACGKEKTIVGTWTVSNNGIVEEYTLNSDGTGLHTVGLISPINITYKTEGDLFQVTTIILQQEIVSNYKYKLDGDKLTIVVDNKDVVYDRK